MNRIIVVCFFLLLLAPNLAGLVLRGEEENLEKRQLAEWPSVTAENYEEAPARIEAYINDHAPFRSRMLDGYAEWNWRVFGSVDHDEVIAGRDGWLFYLGGDSLQDMLGLPVFTERQMEEILEKLLRVRERYVQAPEDFVLFIAPNKERVYGEYLPEAYAPAGEHFAAEELVDYIRAHSDIRVIYPLEELRAAREDCLLYYKTDTHWNMAGAFVGAQRLLGELGGEPAGLDQMQQIWGDDVFRGDLADMVHLPDEYVDDRWISLTGWLDDVEYEAPPEERLSFGSAPGAPDPRRLLMVRDSFGENMRPWLMRYFRRSAIVHVNLLLERGPSVFEGEGSAAPEGTEPATLAGAEPAMSGGTEPAMSVGAEPAMSVGAEPVTPAEAGPAAPDGTEPAMSAGTEPVTPAEAEPAAPDGAGSAGPEGTELLAPAGDVFVCEIVERDLSGISQRLEALLK